jgi:EAL domain-containing protein (putative c-di-GMP-specific phosphodiesterase class I)
MPISTGMPTHTPPGLDGFSGLRSRVRPGFLLSFSVAGLIGLALLAFVVSRILGGAIRTDQLANATSSADLLSAASFGLHVPGASHLTTGELKTLDQITLAARRTADVSGVTIWDLHGRVLYSNDHRTIGGKVGVSPDMSAASGGQTMTTVTTGAKSSAGLTAAQQIEVTTPIYGPRAVKPIAVAEVVLPYAPVAQAISSRTQRINYILVGAALLFYGLLWPLLLRASKAVRSQADPRKQALLRQLANAIRRDELLLHYQPTVDLADGQVVAVEALLRWRHPKRGFLAPNEFLPTVTDYALNSQLALHVVAMALRDCEQWRARGIDAAVNVNLSVANVLDAALPEQIGKLLATGGIPPSALGLEVTETAIVADEGKAAMMLKTLDGMGVRIAIDNFGTGYSSLVGLRDLPVTELKIAREFVMGLRMRPRDKAIVRLITRMAHELEVKVIAEGVEDEDTVNELADLEVDMAQGYYFSKPLPLAELIAWFDAPVMAGRAFPPGPLTPLVTQ